MKRDKEKTTFDLTKDSEEPRGAEQARNRIEVATHLARSQPTVLRDGDSVAIVGGGPAGSFFAHHLLHESRRLDRRLDVVIVEKRRSANPDNDDHHIMGCNFGRVCEDRTKVGPREYDGNCSRSGLS